VPGSVRRVRFGGGNAMRILQLKKSKNIEHSHVIEQALRRKKFSVRALK
jgi:hypothetical protein